MSKNNLDWKEYESVTKYIYETLGKEFGVKVECYGNTCRIPGRSGNSHQIDVLTVQTSGVHTIRTGIECKYLNKKITKDTVMKVLGIQNDTVIDKSIIVSRSGFTKSAFDYAKEYNIGLVELREVQENDLLENSKEIYLVELDINLNILLTRPQILYINIDNNKNLEINEYRDFYKYDLIFKNQSKSSLIDYVTEFQNHLHSLKKLGEIISKKYEVQGTQLFNKQTKSFTEINNLTFIGQLMEIDASQKKSYKLVDQVWLIMKSIFEGRVFAFSENGLIVEQKTKNNPAK